MPGLTDLFPIADLISRWQAVTQAIPDLSPTVWLLLGTLAVGVVGFLRKLPALIRFLALDKISQLLWRNSNYRNLWAGQVISQTGDWLNFIALNIIVLELTDSPLLASLVVVTKLLPAFFFSPFAGLIVDRYDRKRIMLGADIVRAVAIASLYFVREREQVWILYVVILLTVVCRTLFDPAKRATVPNITTKDELFHANALSSLTWSLTLAFGSALGGILVDAIGPQNVLLVDGGTFLLSATFVAFVRIPKRVPEDEEDSHKLISPFNQIIDGFQFITKRPPLAWLIMCKAAGGLSGGVITLITILGREVYPNVTLTVPEYVGIGGAGWNGWTISLGGATMVGLFFAARGIGTALGPMVMRGFVGEEIDRIRRTIGPGFLLGTSYAALILEPPWWLVAGCILCAHFGSSVQWVFSTVILQKTIPDHVRGRVFATEIGLFTLSISLSNLLCGLALDSFGVTPQQMAFFYGWVYLIPATLLTVRQWTYPDGVYPELEE